MNCDTNPELLMAYLDGELDPIERGRVAEHIVGCAECRATVNDLRAVSGALAKWPAPEPVSLPSAQELLATAGFEPAKKPSSWLAITSRWGQVAALILVAGVTAVIVVPRLMSEKAQSPAPVTAAREDGKIAQPGAATATNSSKAETTDGDARQVSPDGPVTGAEQPATPPPPPPAEGNDGLAPAVEEKRQDTPVDERDLKKESEPVTADAATTGTVSAEPAAPAPAPAEPPKLAAAAEDQKNEVARTESGAGGGRAVGQAQPSTIAARKPGNRANAGPNQIRRAVLRLESSDLNSVASRIDAEARSANGHVTRRGAVQSKQDKDSVTIEVEVPAEAFDRAFARIKSLGTVKSETQSSVDISARLDELDDEERAAGDKDASAKSKTAGESPARERRQLEDRARKATIVVTVVKPN